MIRFRCIRCQHPLQIDEGAVGKKLHCPVCYHTLTVPAESTIKSVDPSQLYATDEKPIDVREMRHRHEFTSLRCTVCSANIAVRKEQIGQEVVCPDCETTMLVPPDIAGRIDAALNDTLDKIMLGLDNTPAKDIYGFYDGNSPQKNETGRIPVHCILCNTLMYASDEQVGTELTCPDCDTKTVVPPRSRNIPLPPSIPSNFEGGSTFGTGSALKEPLIPVVCELCGTRMYAHHSQLGEFKTCPDCGRRTLVKAVPTEELIQPELSGNAYAVTAAEPPPRPLFRTLTDYRYIDGSLDREHYDGKQPEEPKVRRMVRPMQPVESKDWPNDIDVETIRQRNRQKKKKTPKTSEKKPLMFRCPLPKRPLTGGLLPPLLTWRVIVPLLASTGLACAAVLLGYLLSELFLLSLGLTGFILTFWACLQTHFCWNMFQASTDANDDIDEGGEFTLVGSFGLLFWMVCGSMLAATPGHLFASCLPGEIFTVTPDDGLVLHPPVIIRDYILLRLSHVFFFPFFFLSCMEAGSYFSPVSRGTLRTFARYTGVWIRFYVLASLLILSLDIALVGIWYLAVELFIAGPNSSILVIVSGIVLGFFWINFFSLLFFRLLGRLAWVLEENVRQEVDDEEENQAASVR